VAQHELQLVVRGGNMPHSRSLESHHCWEHCLNSAVGRTERTSKIHIYIELITSSKVSDRELK